MMETRHVPAMEQTSADSFKMPPSENRNNRDDIENQHDDFEENPVLLGTSIRSASDPAERRRDSLSSAPSLMESNTDVQPGLRRGSIYAAAKKQKSVFNSRKKTPVPLDEIELNKARDFFSRMPMRLVFLTICVSAAITALAKQLSTEAQEKLAGLGSAVAILGAFVSFALVFRTQSCYVRWWEGRQLWGKLIANCINLAGQGQTFLAPGGGAGAHVVVGGAGNDDVTAEPASPRKELLCRSRLTNEFLPEDGVLVDRFLAYCIVFPYACKAVLRGNAIDAANEEGQRLVDSKLLTQEELDALKAHGAFPPFMLIELMRHNMNHSFLGKELTPDDNQEEPRKTKRVPHLPEGMHSGVVKSIEDTLRDLGYNFGGCLRLKSTRMPETYDIFMTYILVAFFVLASFNWASTVGWIAPFAIFVLGTVLNSVIIIGDQMLHPFAMEWAALPLKKFCVVIENEIQSMSRSHDSIKSLMKVR